MSDQQQSYINIDTMAIERDARALRAQVIRSFFVGLRQRLRGVTVTGAQEAA